MILQIMDRFTIIKRLYKEDCIRILKSLSVDDLKRFADIDERDKTNLLRILKIGFKKEDLNFALANLQHIADETFSRFKNHALGENEVVSSPEAEKRDDSAPAPNLGDENDARGEKGANLRRDGFSAERVSDSISAYTPNLGDEIDARGEKGANLRRDGFSADGELDSNSACIPNLGGKINVRGEIEVSRREIKQPDAIPGNTQYAIENVDDVQDPPIQIQIRNEAEIETVFDTYIDSMNNQRDDQHRMKTRQQCMNEISKLGQTKDQFKHNVAEMLKTRIETYNRTKPKYAHHDKEFKFYKENILPMFRMLNLNPADYRMGRSTT